MTGQTAGAVAELADITHDYQWFPRGTSPAGHVARWAEQFPPEGRAAVVGELAHVFRRTYFSRRRVLAALAAVAAADLSGAGDSERFWDRVSLLDLYEPGRSQADLLEAFRGELGAAHGRPQAHPAAGEFVYLDDFLLSGWRVAEDLGAWLPAAPPSCRIHCVFLLSCTHGLARANHLISRRAAALGRAVELVWWHVVRIDDHPARFDAGDVLRPASVPDTPAAAEFFARVGPRLRRPVGGASLFSGEAARARLEHALLLAGLDLMAGVAPTRSYVRPLGLQQLPSFGFGAVVASWRGCPNHCPLALWAGHPDGREHGIPADWYPLFPRPPERQAVELTRLRDLIFVYPDAALMAEPLSRPIPPAE